MIILGHVPRLVIAGSSGEGEGKMIMSSEKIMEAFLRACYARPEHEAVVSDHIDATREQCVYTQALNDSQLMLATVLWPQADLAQRVARVGEIEQRLLVESDDTPNFRAHA